ncbi:ABC-three component system protein [Flavobacterium sp. ACN6]|uniref:ABC-three component system protein n=1 Tax=Flavobacterium sp. ACN6 TaxID=1920426 RepID=UPI000BB3578B|nr:ABC-three component system protein [Flavobacterium sp. ACN6]PBJ14366.1 hypothetical protein BSF42_07840 [Flavobacterium sp. ACN6]
MLTTNPNDIHSAADTWSGFIYQGKIALLHVLTLILNENVDEFYLQLDSLEDFAIIRYDGGALIPVSLHQVKAMKSHFYSAYQEAFEKLERRKISFPCERNAYFHLATENEKTKLEIETDHPTISIYEYDREPFCKIENLQNKINVKTQECLRNLGKLAESNNPEYVSLMSETLEELITSQIIAVHANNHRRNGLTINEGAYYFTIPLNNFVAELNSDINAKIYDSNYYRQVLRYDLNRYFQEFCFDLEEEIDGETKEKLSNYLIYFNGLTDVEFQIFLQNIMPHRNVKFSTLQEYKDNSLNIDEFKGALALILKELRDSDKDTINKVGWICVDNKRYFPSTIDVSDTSNSKKKISEKIVNVALDTLVDIPFNSDYIITEGCQVESLEKEASNIFKVEDDDTIYTKITNWRKVSLIPLEEAKRKLN